MFFHAFTISRPQDSICYLDRSIKIADYIRLEVLNKLTITTMALKLQATTRRTSQGA